ncbi:sodium:calcium antiporter [Acidobacteria bacterium AH-259-A15]|nr:sodium:calcium antiporter [Acidobacteria bacterium AH-259-A15]
MRLFIAGTVAVTLPALYMRCYDIHIDPRVDSIIFGLGILGAAFLLSWAAEVAQIEISRGLALAILALIAILPEYAVDLYFAWVAAYEPQYTHYATANMTGANRLLVGAGWPFIVFLFCLKFRRKGLQLDRANLAEISYLTVATIYAFIIPLKGHLSLIDCFFLVGIFGAYAWRTAVMEVHEPELVGPARLIAQLVKGKRRLVNVFLFVFSGITIFASAEPFAEALIGSGELLEIDEYFLVQWLAPIASEAPEFIIAAVWTLRAQPTAAIGALISSKVNQWTLLVGTIPLVYSISLGRIGQMPLDSRQSHEILLTAAQSIFAVVVLMNLNISLWEAGGLFLLFTAQLVYPDIRAEVSILYFILTAILLFRRTHDLLPLIREGLFNRKEPGLEG